MSNEIKSGGPAFPFDKVIGGKGAMGHGSRGSIMSNDQTLELQVYNCLQAIKHKDHAQILRELRTRFYKVNPNELIRVLDKIIECEVE